MLSNVNVVVSGQVKSEKSSLPVTVRVSKTRVFKLPMTIPGLGLGSSLVCLTQGAPDGCRFLCYWNQHHLRN